MIARVFPRKTAMSPTDALAFFDQPTIENIADCIKAGVTEVHISVTFTWDIEKAEDLYYAWQILGVPVEVGGPAFDDRMGDFTPGLYLREGMIFTSRGCTKDCWICSVPRCAHGEIKELPIVDGTSSTTTSSPRRSSISELSAPCSRGKNTDLFLQGD